MEYIESAPASWRRVLTLSSVPKDGSAYKDSFAVCADKPVLYWGQIYELLAPLAVDVTVFRTEGRILANVGVKGKIGTDCARCLEPAEAEFSGELRYLFSLRNDEPERAEKGHFNESDGDEDVILLNSWEDEIDLRDQIWETMITALPPKVLCKPDCKGLCQTCGANLNRTECGCGEGPKDIRMEALRAFMEKK